MLRLSVKTLGGLAIAYNGQPLVLRNRKAQALLIYLSYTPHQTFNRNHLQSLLWSESDDKRGRASLRQVLAQLQRTLPDVLRLDRQLVSLRDPHAVELDVHQLSDNVALYEGPFLQGFSLKQAAGWDEWLFIQREAIDARFLAELENHGRAALAKRNHSAAIGHFQRALAVDGWREQTHRLLMETFWQAGDRAAALAQFEQCQQVLRDELGVGVSAETAALAERIAALDSVQTNNLPAADGRAFFGREAELAEIAQLLQTPTSRLITLVGLGGIGKTSLALATARQQQTQFADGVWLVDLVGVEPENMLTPFLQALGIRPGARGTPRRWLLNHLKSRHLLLVLDNFEHLLAHTQLIEAILHAAPQVKLLVTSRERLNLPAEWGYAVTGLPSSVSGESHDSVAVRLFVDHAKRMRHSFVPTRAQLAQIGEICQLVEGMPLAIQLAAAWVRVLSVEEISAEINHSLTFLHATQRNIPDRQRSLTAIFEYAYSRLMPNAQAVLRQLSLLRGSFDRPLAAAVANATLFTLTQLVDQALVERTVGNRYRLHEQVRQFARERLAENSAEAAQAQQRRSDHFAGLLRDALPKLKSPAQRGTLAMLNGAIDNVLAVWERWVQTGQFDALLATEETLYYFYRLQEQWFGLEQQFERSVNLLSAAAQAPPLLIARLQLRLATSYAERSLNAAALRLLDTCEGVLQQVGNSADVATILQIRALIAQSEWDLESAVVLGQQALEAWLTLDRQFETTYALSYLGNIAYSAMRYDDAAAAYQQALTIYQHVGDESAVALMEHNLAYVLESQGAWDAALALIESADARFMATQTMLRRFTSVESLSVFLPFSNLPLPPSAEVELLTWHATIHEDESPLDFMFALGALAAVWTRQGRFEEAVVAYDQAFEIAQRLHLGWAVTLISIFKVGIAKQMGQVAEVGRLAAQSLQMLTLETDQVILATILWYVVQAYLELSCFDVAILIALWLRSQAVSLDPQLAALLDASATAELEAAAQAMTLPDLIHSLATYADSGMISASNILAPDA